MSYSQICVQGVCCREAKPSVELLFKIILQDDLLESNPKERCTVPFLEMFHEFKFNCTVRSVFRGYFNIVAPPF